MTALDWYLLLGMFCAAFVGGVIGVLCATRPQTPMRTGMHVADPPRQPPGWGGSYRPSSKPVTTNAETNPERLGRPPSPPRR